MGRSTRVSLFAVFLVLAGASVVRAQPFVHAATFGRFGFMTSLCAFVQVPCEGPSLKTLNPATGNQLSRIELAGFQTQEFVRGMALSADGRTLMVSASRGTVHAVLAVDAGTSAIARQAALPAAPGELAMSADGARVFVAVPSENAVLVLDAATLATSASITVGTSPASLELSPNGSVLFVSNGASDTVSRISTATLLVTSTIATASQPGALTFSRDGSRLYVVCAGSRTVSIIDTATNLVVGSAPAGDSTKPPPRDIAVTAAGDLIVVSLASGASSFIGGRTGELLIVDGMSNAVIGSMSMAGPWGLDFDTAGTLYVAAGGGVKLVDVAARRVTATLQSTYDPYLLVVSKATGCQYESTLSTTALPATGGTATFTVPAAAACAWSINNLPAWIQPVDAVSGTGPGSVRLTIPATSSPRAATFTLGPQQFTFNQTIPAMSVDVLPGATIAQPGVISGWAIERDTRSVPTLGSGVDAVHVWAYPAGGGSPIFVGGARLGKSRSDVGAVFGDRYGSSGFSVATNVLAPGTYTLVSSARGTLTQTFDQSFGVVVTIASSPPLMAVDEPLSGALVKQPFLISGWAIDWSGPAGPGVDAVHVWAYPPSGPPQWVGAATYGQPRPDVAAVLGTPFTNSGFSLPGNRLAPGSYQLAIYPHSALTGTFNNMKVVSIVVAPSDPQMHVDLPVATGSVQSGFTVAGWAADLGAASGSGVDAIHVWAYPAGGGAPIFVGAGTAESRPDVGAVFGAQFSEAGFRVSAAALAGGVYDLVVSARSTVTGTFNNVRSVRIVVQ